MLTVALIDTLIAQINVAVKEYCTAPVVSLNVCDKQEVNGCLVGGAAEIFELCEWAAKWKRLRMVNTSNRAITVCGESAGEGREAFHACHAWKREACHRPKHV